MNQESQFGENIKKNPAKEELERLEEIHNLKMNLYAAKPDTEKSFPIDTFRVGDPDLNKFDGSMFVSLQQLEGKKYFVCSEFDGEDFLFDDLPSALRKMADLIQERL